jgi:hypothetical protein
LHSRSRSWGINKTDDQSTTPSFNSVHTWIEAPLSTGKSRDVSVKRIPEIMADPMAAAEVAGYF